MARNIPRSGKRIRPKTAIRGKRYLCASCRKRSPKPVKEPAPWYCPLCLERKTRRASSALNPKAPRSAQEIPGEGGND